MEVNNNRPLGLSGDFKVLTPNHLRPVHSGLAPSLGDLQQDILHAKEKFDRDWIALYPPSVLRQTK